MENKSAPNIQAEVVLHAQDYLQMLRSRWKEALLVFLLVFISSAVVTKLIPPRYQSVVTIEIKPPRDLINVTYAADVNPIYNTVNIASREYMTTQYEVMVSQNNLIAVANKLDLANEWQVDETQAAGRLSGMISVRPRLNTNLIDIYVSGTDPRVAQQICQAVVDCYKELREEKENAVITEAINKRYEVLRSRQDELERKADVVRQYIRAGKYLQGIWSNSGYATPVSTSSEEQTLNELNQQRLRQENAIANMIVHIGKLQNLRDDELLGYVTGTDLLSAESYCSENVRQLNELYKKEVSDRAQLLLSGYGEKHPVILRLDEKHKDTSTLLNEALVGMRDAMVNQLEVRKAEMEDLEKRYAEARNRLRDKTLEDQKVKNALQEYAAEKSRYDKLENDYIADKMRMMAPRTSVETYSRPNVPTAPSFPNYKLNLIIGAVMGVFAGLIVAFIYNFFDTSIKTLEDAERNLALPVLGVIPQDAGLLLLQDGNSPDAEAYRILRTNVELKRSLFKATTFTIVSANAGEGKTTTLSNLAYVFAQAGYSTLMIDADLRRPRLARYAELKTQVGLTNYLAGASELSDVIFQTGEPNLYMLPSGPLPSDPSGMIGSHRMNDLLTEVSRRFDIVLIDSPPVLGVSDASLLVSKSDATLLVIQPRKMPIKALLRSKMLVENAGGQIMGLVMNNVDISGDAQYQYYTTYYSYYTNDKGRPESKADKKKSARTESVSSEPAKELARSEKRVVDVVDDNSDDLY